MGCSEPVRIARSELMTGESIRGAIDCAPSGVATIAQAASQPQSQKRLWRESASIVFIADLEN
jgi:hypothetical protein